MKNIKQLVIEEATKLREHATVLERSRLDIEGLNPKINTLCIYGQMTRDCWSKRATDLLNMCTTPYSRHIKEFTPTLDLEFKPTIGRRFSPIEVFITDQDPTINHILVAYIKGQRNTLTIEDLS